MKKIISVLAVMFVMLTAAVAMASSNYPDHLAGDDNFIICDGHMGTAWYIDRSSLVVEKYEPPQYIIAVNVVTVDNADRGNTEINKVRTFRFFYNSDKCEMYVDRDNNDNWRYLKPLGSWAESGVSMPAGEIAYALAYNVKFYGSKKWYDSHFGKYSNAFADEFYRNL